MPVPVVGNGDLLFRHEIDAALRAPGAPRVMTARGALIKPWMFREATEGDLDPTGEERLVLYRRYVALAKVHWGADERGIARVREFLLWHLGFWCRYAPRRADGSYPAMQQREAGRPGRHSKRCSRAPIRRRMRFWPIACCQTARSSLKRRLIQPLRPISTTTPQRRNRSRGPSLNGVTIREL